MALERQLRRFVRSPDEAFLDSVAIHLMQRHRKSLWSRLQGRRWKGRTEAAEILGSQHRSAAWSTP